MDDINLKKLISSFLTLAIIASVLALILPPIYSGFTNLIAPTPQSLTFLNQSSSTASSSPNAFLPKTETLADYYNSTVSEFNSNGSVNLTQLTAKEFAQSLVSSNPNGPIASANGQFSIISPDQDQIISKIQSYIQNNNALVIPDPPYTYQIINNPTPKQNTDYLKSIKDILNKTIFNPSINVSFSNFSTPEDFATIALVDDQAIQQLSALKVPIQLLNFHKALIKDLYDKKFIANNLANYQSDPLKSAIIAQAGIDGLISQLFNKDGQSIFDNFNQIKFQPVKDISQKSNESWLNRILSFASNLAFQPALAQGGAVNVVGITDPTFLSDMPQIVEHLTSIDTTAATTAANTTKKNIHDTVEVPMWRNMLYIFIGQIVHQIINSTTKWVQSGFNGNPAWITNWQDMINQATNNAAGAIIQQYAPFLCAPFQISLQLSSRPVNPSQYLGCTLSDVVSNIQDFENNFQNGGWLAYTTSLEPNNTLIGAQLLLNDKVIQAESEAQSKVENQAQANQGVAVQTVCTQVFIQKPNPEAAAQKTDGTCVDATGQKVVPCFIQETTTTNASAVDPNSQQCAKTRVTTPGMAVAAAVNNAFSADTNQIVNSQDIDALVNALTNALITKVVQAAKGGFAAADTSSYQAPVPLFQMQSAGQNQTNGLHDIGTLVQTMTTAQSYLSAEKLNEGYINSLLSTSIPNALAEITKYLPQITALTEDVSPATCYNAIMTDLVNPSIDGLKQQISTINTEVQSAIPDLQGAIDALNLLQWYDKNISTSSEPILGSSTLPTSFASQINQDEQLISSSNNVIDFQNNIIKTINNLNGNILPSNIQNSPFSAFTPSATFSQSDAVLGYNYLSNLVNTEISSTTQTLSNLSSQFSSSSNELTIITNASSSYNNYLSYLNDINNNLTDIQSQSLDRISLYQSLISLAGQQTDNSTSTINGLENNLISLTNKTLGRLSSTSPVYGILNNSLSQIASNNNNFNTSVNSIISSLQSSISASPSLSDTYYDNANQSLINIINNEISIDQTLLSNTLSSLTSNTSAYNTQLPLAVYNANSALDNLFQNLTFNNLVKAISTDINTYSDSTSNLQTLAGASCGFGKMSNSLRDLAKAVNDLNSNNISIHFVPQLCFPPMPSSQCNPFDTSVLQPYNIDNNGSATSLFAEICQINTQNNLNGNVYPSNNTTAPLIFFGNDYNANNHYSCLSSATSSEPLASHFCITDHVVNLNTATETLGVFVSNNANNGFTFANGEGHVYLSIWDALTGGGMSTVQQASGLGLSLPNISCQ